VSRNSLIRRAEKVLNWRAISGRPYDDRVGAGTCDGTGARGRTGTRCYSCRGGFRTRPYETRPYGTGACGETEIRGGTGTHGCTGGFEPPQYPPHVR